MAAVLLFIFFALFSPMLLYSAESEKSFLQEFRSFFRDCPPTRCGKLGEIHTPFTNTTLPEYCGPFVVDGCHREEQEIRLEKRGKSYGLESIFQDNSILITDRDLRRDLKKNSCQAFNNLSLPSLPYASFQITSNLTFFKCPRTVHVSPSFDFSYENCANFSIHYAYKNRSLPSVPPDCSIVQLPVDMNKINDGIFNLITAKFSLQVHNFQCYWCHLKGWECPRHSEAYIPCVSADKGDNKFGLKLGLGLGCPAAIMIILLPIIFIRRRYRRKYASSIFLSQNVSSDPSSKIEQKRGNVYFAVPTFSYTELEQATNNFEKELGHGGFGTVYYGKLKDGREVAVKRLCIHHYRRVERFVNEVEILTNLRHKNLVSLYGCTARHNRDLLLVYEFIPNGSIADHLHGERANLRLLTWPIRLRIAIETAGALSYLHASDVIHRDVKTDNILLDNNFCVKVVDFGLSRLFPTDVSHVSTAPQGTPGYVDPEYYQFYQLTDKSDVYSFGVFLIELISSMPAVDINRHRHEINLGELAINKIKKCALDELIDPCLGHQTDEEVKRTTTLIAEVAFRCLQQNRESRPSMDEVLEDLKRIGSLEKKFEYVAEHDDNEASKSLRPLPSPTVCDEVSLLKNNRLPTSPNSVSDSWISSGSITPSNSS